MGGGAMPEGGGGGHGKKKKKALDAVINVIPAIDLLSCCIAFLLMTAVWTQINKLQVQQSSGQSDGTPPNPEKTITINLTMTDKGFLLSINNNPTEIPAMGRTADGGPQYDLKQLEAKLKQIRTEFPDQSAVTIAAEDAVIYDDLVRVIDLSIGAGLPNVSVQAAG
jgi:biopolymer transport protein ExbD